MLLIFILPALAIDDINNNGVPDDQDGDVSDLGIFFFSDQIPAFIEDEHLFDYSLGVNSHFYTGGVVLTSPFPGFTTLGAFAMSTGGKAIGLGFFPNQTLTMSTFINQSFINQVASIHNKSATAGFILFEDLIFGTNISFDGVNAANVYFIPDFTGASIIIEVNVDAFPELATSDRWLGVTLGYDRRNVNAVFDGNSIPLIPPTSSETFNELEFRQNGQTVFRVDEPVLYDAESTLLDQFSLSEELSNFEDNVKPPFINLEEGISMEAIAGSVNDPISPNIAQITIFFNGFSEFASRPGISSPVRALARASIGDTLGGTKKQTTISNEGQEITLYVKNGLPMKNVDLNLENVNLIFVNDPASETRSFFENIVPGFANAYAVGFGGFAAVDSNVNLKNVNFSGLDGADWDGITIVNGVQGSGNSVVMDDISVSNTQGGVSVIGEQFAIQNSDITSAGGISYAAPGRPYSTGPQLVSILNNNLVDGGISVQGLVDATVFGNTLTNSEFCGVDVVFDPRDACLRVVGGDETVCSRGTIDFNGASAVIERNLFDGTGSSVLSLTEPDVLGVPTNLTGAGVCVYLDDRAAGTQITIKDNDFVNTFSNSIVINNLDASLGNDNVRIINNWDDGTLADQVALVVDNTLDRNKLKNFVLVNESPVPNIIAAEDDDNDGILNTEDECPVNPGTAQFNGCDSSLNVTAITLSVGTGRFPRITIAPIFNMTVRAFDRSLGSCAANMGVSWMNYDDIFLNCTPANEKVTGANGLANLNVNHGNYIIIGDALINGQEIIVAGVPRNDHVNAGETKPVLLFVIINPRGIVLPAKLRELLGGSELSIIEPEYILWNGTEETYPFIYMSEGNWTVNAEISPPEGFVADTNSITVDVNSDVQAVQFVINDTGSTWVPTEVNYNIEHKGKKNKIKSMIGVALTSRLASEKGVKIAKIKKNIKKAHNTAKDDDIIIPSEDGKGKPREKITGRAVDATEGAGLTDLGSLGGAILFISILNMVGIIELFHMVSKQNKKRIITKRTVRKKAKKRK